MRVWISKDPKHPEGWPVIPVVVDVPFTMVGWYGIFRPVEYIEKVVRELRAPANGPIYLGKR